MLPSVHNSPVTAPVRRVAGLAALLMALPVVLLALVVAQAPAASAHNVLISSDPKDGSTVAEPPAQITLVFNDDVLDVGSAVQLKGPDGVVDLDAPAADGPRLVQQLPGALPAGQYEMVWRVTSADGHPIDGTLTFTASAAGAQATPTEPEPASKPTGAASPSIATAEATATTQAEPAASPAVTQAANSEDGGIPAWVWSVGAVVVIGGAGVAFAAARRSRDHEAG